MPHISPDSWHPYSFGPRLQCTHIRLASDKRFSNTRDASVSSPESQLDSRVRQLLSAGDHAGAIEYLSRAVDRNPGDLAARRLRASVSFRTNDLRS